MPVNMNRINEKVTKTLIRTFPTSIALIRPGGYVDDGAGGRKRSGAARTQPAVKRYLTAADAGYYQQFQQGDMQIKLYQLIGPVGDDIRKGDYFIYDGDRYTVQFVDPDKTYQTKAVCTRKNEGA